MHIPLVYGHLFYKYFVRRSVVQATKGKRASLLMDVVILVFYKHEPIHRIPSFSKDDKFSKGHSKISLISIEGWISPEN